MENPVNNAQKIVPSRVPIILKLKKSIDNKTEATTQETSKTIFTVPNFIFKTSEMDFTNASPEFIMTLAQTTRDTPKPDVIIPIKIQRIRSRYVLFGKSATSRTQISVKEPNTNDNGSCSSWK